MATDFLVRRDNLRQCRFLPDQTMVGLQPDQVMLRTSVLALTANNITYAAFGEAMAYWAFFPAPSGWGRIPVWGYADVVGSRHEQFAEGERVFGYLPISTHLVIQPERVGIVRFGDATPHRRKLPAAYQIYTRTAGDSYYRAQDEAAYALLRPLFATSFLIEEFLAEQQYFGARRILLASASSKTALGIADRLRRRTGAGPEVVALTSAGNLEFCQRTGGYHRAIAYPELASLDASVPTVLVDMSGNGTLLHDIHHHLGDSLKYSCMVGGTHWEQRATQHGLPGAKPVFFFAPSHFQTRSQQWGYAVLESRLAEALQQFIDASRSWLQLVHNQGPEAIEACYHRLLEGQVPPQEGHLLSL